MKTEMTTAIEKALYANTVKQGVYGCFEVTIGINGHERVDYLTYDSKGVFRCYEIKVSKADFHSKNKLSFVGDYNYLVVPESLVNEIFDDVQDGMVGILSYHDHGGIPYLSSVRRATKRVPAIPRGILKDSMIRSMSREVSRMMETDDVSTIKTLRRENSHQQKQISRLNDEKHFWLHRIGELQDFVETVTEEGFWDTGPGAVFEAGRGMGKNPFLDGRAYLPPQYPSMTAQESAEARELVLQFIQARKQARTEQKEERPSE